MNDNLVGYLLNSLDDDTRRGVEVSLKANPDERRQLELLRQALEPLAADRDSRDYSPAPDLAVRTLARVAEHCARELPRAPATLSRGSGGRALWRRADFLVAASLLIIAIGIGAPYLIRQHDHAMRIDCQNHLRQIGQALQGFRDQKRQYPNVKEASRPVAGMVVPMLVQAGQLDPHTDFRCPGVRVPPSKAPTLDELKKMSKQEFDQWAPFLLPCYAYSLGYYEGAGHRGPHSRPGVDHLVPIVADRPPPAGQLGNSLNHGGVGQNVLFQDGHISFVNTRHAGIDGDDIYLNANGEIKAGKGPRDTVLGPSDASP